MMQKVPTPRDDENAAERAAERTKLEFDFDAVVRPVTNYATVPAGTYLCRIDEVRESRTPAGHERWALRLVVADGPHAGRQAAWDSLVMSREGRSRVRMVFEALGLPCTGKVQVSSQELEGKTVKVQVVITQYATPEGAAIARNEVPHDGYARVGSTDA